ncbi:MAG: flagellar basal body rod protein FlgB [Holophagaceae bacterium]
MFDLISGNGMIQTMDRALTLASKRQTLIASNLANLDTPGYRTQDFSFEGAMKAAVSGQNSPPTLRSTHPLHLQGSASSTLPASTDTLLPRAERNDGNDVSLDRENMLLARTQSSYQAASTFMQVELRKLYTTIRESVAH